MYVQYTCKVAGGTQSFWRPTQCEPNQHCRVTAIFSFFFFKTVFSDKHCRRCVITVFSLFFIYQTKIQAACKWDLRASCDENPLVIVAPGQRSYWTLRTKVLSGRKQYRELKGKLYVCVNMILYSVHRDIFML